VKRLGLLLLLAACKREAPPDGSCLPGAAPGPDTPWWYPDDDGDGAGAATGVQACEAPSGHVATTGDCDDGDPAISPTASETCDGVDQDCDGVVDDDATDAPTWHPDADGDGYGDMRTDTVSCVAPAGALADASDCEDARADVNPDGTEVCNDLDDDCDGLVDDADDLVDDPATWYADLDGDGFGDAYNEVLACYATGGLTTDTSDCDDAHAEVNPEGTEVCDGLDNDCNGHADDDAAGETVWYIDGDGDGYGRDGFSVLACDAPTSFVSNAIDCDDGNALVYPDATEVCDGFDGDCDGVTDDDAVDSTTWFPDADADGFANPAAGALACDRPLGWLELEDATDCDDVDPSINPDATEGCDDGIDADCDGFERPCALASPISVGDTVGDVWYGGTVGARAGESMAWVDTDGDGLDELLVGVFQDSTVASFAGSAFLVDALADGPHSGFTARGYVYSEDVNEYVGKSVANAGDLDGDGDDEALVGAYRNSRNADFAGAAYIFDGPMVTADVSTADTILYGMNQDDEAGTGVAGVGDLDADGFDDIGVSAPGLDFGIENLGAIYVNHGPLSGPLDLAASDARLIGVDGAERVARLCAGGDIDADGAPDFIAGSYASPSMEGRAYVVTDVPLGDSYLSDATASMDGLVDGDSLASSCAIAGDVNNDGYDDILLGANMASINGTQSGTAYLVLGPVLGAFDMNNAEATFYGELPGDMLGAGVSMAGDIDGDNRDDMLFGASGNDRVGTTSGAVYLVLGPYRGTAVVDEPAYAILLPHYSVTESGSSIAGGGDIDGDGRPEVAWGGPDYGYILGGAGGAFILPGTEL
jgi:hypothetical protein